MLCELDYEDTKRNFLRPLSYSTEDEFIAFDGRILAIGHADGTMVVTSFSLQGLHDET